MKERLRYEYRQIRKDIQSCAREAADGAIADAVLAAFADKQSFFVYFSYGSEADTHALVSRLVALGKSVYLPRVEGKDMVAVAWTGGENMKKSSMGICEPEGRAFEGSADVVITPLLAVNPSGYRLGYGGGFYDRYFCSHGGIKVGIGYSVQFTDENFQDGTDVPLDMFISERGITYFGK